MHEIQHFRLHFESIWYDNLIKVLGPLGVEVAFYLKIVCTELIEKRLLVFLSEMLKGSRGISEPELLDQESKMLKARI